jgi:hypothetical protein
LPATYATHLVVQIAIGMHDALGSLPPARYRERLLAPEIPV